MAQKNRKDSYSEKEIQIIKEITEKYPKNIPMAIEMCRKELFKVCNTKRTYQGVAYKYYSEKKKNKLDTVKTLPTKTTDNPINSTKIIKDNSGKLELIHEIIMELSSEEKNNLIKRIFSSI